MRRYWWVPLVIAAVFDLLLLVHARFSAGAQVDTAVRRSLLVGACRETMLIDINGVPDQQLQVLFVSAANASLSQLVLKADYGPSGALVASSSQMIAGGNDSQFNTTALGGASPHPLLSLYTQQIRAGADWLNAAPCIPLANPRSSHLHAAGRLSVDGAAYRVYQGKAPFRQNGQPIFAGNASVWMGVANDGTLGFAVVKGRFNASSVDAVWAMLFRYTRPTAATTPSTSASAAGQRVQFYNAMHSDAENLLSGLGLVSSTSATGTV